MPQPTRSDVHVNRPLTVMSIAYIQRRDDFIASKVFPVIPCQKQSDRYFKYLKDYWMRTGSQKRAPGSESAGGGFGLDNTPNYFADVWSFHYDVADQIRANADQPLNLDRDATMFVTQNQMLRREVVWATKYMTTGIWTGGTGGTDVTPSPQWDTSTGTPITDIDTQKRNVKSGTAFLPDTFVAADDVFFAIKNQASVLDRIKYTQRGVVTEELLAALLQLRQFLVSQAVINSAAEGAAFSGGFLVSNQALLVYSNPQPGIMQPSGGYTFACTGMYGSGAGGEGRIKSYRVETRESDRIEGDQAWDQKLVGSDLGAFFNNCLSSP